MPYATRLDSAGIQPQNSLVSPGAELSGSKIAALRWQLQREERRARKALLAALATPLVTGVVWVISGIPAHFISRYPDDSAEHTAFIYNAMTLSALICGLAYLVYCMTRRALAARQSEKYQLQLFQLGAAASINKEQVQENFDKTDPGSVAGQKRRIFLIHGHDTSSLHEVSRFAERLGFEVVVLRELPSGGRTIIEKFIALSEVDFAIALLMPDDRGGRVSEQFEEQRLRARQNVLLELGFFLGKLGRDRVCVLYRSGVEIPSDYGGVLFVELDDKGAWKLPLAGEMREAGLTVDLDLVFASKR